MVADEMVNHYGEFNLMASCYYELHFRSVFICKSLEEVRDLDCEGCILLRS